MALTEMLEGPLNNQLHIHKGERRRVGRGQGRQKNERWAQEGDPEQNEFSLTQWLHGLNYEIPVC